MENRYICIGFFFFLIINKSIWVSWRYLNRSSNCQRWFKKVEKRERKKRCPQTQSSIFIFYGNRIIKMKPRVWERVYVIVFKWWIMQVLGSLEQCSACYMWIHNLDQVEHVLYFFSRVPKDKVTTQGALQYYLLFFFKYFYIHNNQELLYFAVYFAHLCLVSVKCKAKCVSLIYVQT